MRNTFNRRLTIKQKRFVEEALRTLNPSEAVRRVYDVKKKGVEYSIAWENLRKPQIKAYMHHLMTQEGYDVKQHTGLIFDGAQATKRDHFSGEITPDWQARYKFIDMLNKISDVYPAEKTVTTKLSDDLESIMLRSR